MTSQTSRRVVISGLGVVAPNGIGKAAFWLALKKGMLAVKPVQRFSTNELPIQVAGEVRDFNVEHYIDRKLANRTDRVTHYVLAAVQEALSDAQLVLEQEDPNCVGVVIANTTGGVEFVAEQIEALYMRGPRFMSVYTAIAWLHVAHVGQTSVRYGLKGYSKTPVNDIVGGLDAFGIAYQAIRRGAADILITGGCESLVQPILLLLLGHSDQCATGDDPDGYRPFDQRASGFILAEGAGICIIEEYEHARRRGAHIYGEIVGYGQTNDALAFGMPAPDGKQYARAMELALHEAHMLPEDVGYFSLDGRALPHADQAEFDALKGTFGTELCNLSVSVPRTMYGHSFAAAGALDTITALLAFQDGIIPPTINCEQLVPHYSLNLVQHEPESLSRSTALIGGRGLGGANVVVAIKKI
ncbi:MAG TPA: beta-ketoacyl synthase N-terminal-like domain-containing protein [Ktedonobacteraceae bacterium]|nr:beta-ketoacyl synthase N-terminal-like domain-containing protein [Ktedonobacteraceae bacterium]